MLIVGFNIHTLLFQSKHIKHRYINIMELSEKIFTKPLFVLNCIKQTAPFNIYYVCI